MELWVPGKGMAGAPCMERRGVLPGKVHLVDQELRKEGMGNDEGRI